MQYYTRNPGTFKSGICTGELRLPQVPDTYGGADLSKRLLWEDMSDQTKDLGVRRCPPQTRISGCKEREAAAKPARESPLEMIAQRETCTADFRSTR